jgi:hypothetical protein
MKKMHICFFFAGAPVLFLVLVRILTPSCLASLLMKNQSTDRTRPKVQTHGTKYRRFEKPRRGAAGGQISYEQDDGVFREA